jgi:hypothetical protein
MRDPVLRRASLAHEPRGPRPRLVTLEAVAAFPLLPATGFERTSTDRR